MQAIESMLIITYSVKIPILLHPSTVMAISMKFKCNLDILGNYVSTFKTTIFNLLAFSNTLHHKKCKVHYNLLPSHPQQLKREMTF